MKRGRIVAFLAALVLTACGSDVDETQSAQTFVAFGKKLVGRGEARASGPVGLTRAALAQIPQPVDLVTVEGLRVSALVLYAGTNGGVETWTSIDDKTISFRQGVIVATRGLGPDLIAADVPPLARIASGTGTYVRTHTTLGDEDATVRNRFLCTYKVTANEEIVIVERRHAVRRVQETCSGDSARFINEYWFQGGTLRQSRQWMGPELDYITVARLRD